MARRIDIELTSTRDDGSWTWRAAGARQPKGVVTSAVLPGSPAVGDVLRVEVETGLDGTEITAVLADKAPRAEPERLQLLTRDLKDDELVVSKLVGKRGRDRDRDDDRRGGRGRGGPGGRDGRPGERGRGGRDGRPGGGREGRPGEREGRDGRPGGDRAARHPRDTPGRGDGPGRDGGRPDRPRRRPDDATPRPKRLRPQRTHRRAVLDTLEVHERPVAEEVLRGGMAAVRQAVEKQNAQARAEGRPEVDPAQLEALAERLLPRLRAADWRDRAEAALADLDELDLRDLRTVVAGADAGARDDEAKALVTQLREGLERRVEADQAAWLAEMTQLLGEGRVVRALRVSSRPPKAGSPLPLDLATRLIEAASAALTAETPTDRWSTVLDALALSPVHAKVAPASLPEAPSDELKAVVAAAGTRTPLVAQALGVEPAPPPRRRRGPGKGGPGGARPVPPPPPKDEASTPASTDEAPIADELATTDTPAPAAEPEVVSEVTPEAVEASGDAPIADETSTAEPGEPVAEEGGADDAPLPPTEEAPVEPEPVEAPIEEPPSAPTAAPAEADPADAAGAEDTPVEPAVPADGDGSDEEDRGSQPASE